MKQKSDKNNVRNDIDSKEDEPAGTTFSVTTADSDSENEEDNDQWNFGDFWGNITQVNDEIVDFFDKKLEAVALQFVISLMKHMTRVLNDSQSIPILEEQLFQMLRQLPILGDILPEESLRADMVPNPKFTFHNWALTQQSNPAKMKFLRTKSEIIEFVREANIQKRECECQLMVILGRHCLQTMVIFMVNYYQIKLPV